MTSDLHHPACDDAAHYHQWQLKAGGSPNRCGPFSLAIAANLVLGNQVFDGDAIAEELRTRWIEWKPQQLLPRLNRFPPDAATMPGAIARYLRNNGIAAALHTFGRLTDIKDALRRGQYAIPIIGQLTHHVGWRWLPWGHAIVAVGYAPTHLLTVDPGQKTITHPTLHPYPNEKFMRLWTGMARMWLGSSERRPTTRPAYPASRKTRD